MIWIFKFISLKNEEKNQQRISQWIQKCSALLMCLKIKQVVLESKTKAINKMKKKLSPCVKVLTYSQTNAIWIPINFYLFVRATKIQSYGCGNGNNNLF